MRTPLARTITFLALIAVAWEPACAQSPKKYALLIAVAKYDHAGMNKPEPLKYPEADAKAIGDFLKSGGYQVELLLGKAATRDAVSQKLMALTQQGDSDGVILVGMFGHGVQTETRDEEQAIVQEGCFCPFDTSLRTVKDAKGRELFDNNGQPLVEPDPASLIKLSELMTSLKLAKAGHRIVLADCCRTVPNQARGRAFGAGFRAQDLPDDTSVLFGCSPNERAFEHPDWGHGAFTKCLLDEMRELSLTGSVETAQLAVALKRRVPKLVASVAPRDTQTPKLFSTDSVDLQLTLDDLDYLRGVALIWGIGVKINEPLGFEHMRKAAERGHPLAMAQIARSYFSGQQVSKNLEEATRWANQARPLLLKRAQDGDPAAQVSLGGLELLGVGANKNVELAAQWYSKAAEQGYAEGQCKLGLLYRDGRGVAKDPVQAVKWLRKSADQNFSMAQFNLAAMYHDGIGVEKDFAESVRLYRQSAEQGESIAQYNLGYAYKSGEGVAKDLGESFKWYQKAAEQKHRHAEYFVGVAYMNGQGVAKDPAAAVEWFRKSAEQRLPSAQFALGIAFSQGEGVTKDITEGAHWLRRTVANPETTADIKQQAQKRLKDLGMQP